MTTVAEYITNMRRGERQISFELKPLNCQFERVFIDKIFEEIHQKYSSIFESKGYGELDCLMDYIGSQYSEIWRNEEISVSKFEGFPDFQIQVNQNLEDVEVVRVAHQAVEEWHSTTDRAWKPGSPMKIFSTTPIQKACAPNRRLDWNKVRNEPEGALRGFIAVEEAEAQFSDQFLNCVVRKVEKFAKQNNLGTRQVVIADVSLKSFGLAFTGRPEYFESSIQGVSIALRGDSRVTNWVRERSGKVFGRLQGHNSSVPTRIVKLSLG